VPGLGKDFQPRAASRNQRKFGGGEQAIEKNQAEDDRGIIHRVKDRPI
jgi:hypothetical protein